MVSVFRSFLSEDAVEEKEDQARTQTFQADNWQIDHSSGLTANKDTFVEKLGQQRESAVIASAGGGRGTDAGAIPVQLQEHDGKKLAMQNSQQGTFAQVMLGNSVMQADDERETVAAVDADLEQQMRDRAPVIEAFAAKGDKTAVVAMLSGLPGGIGVSVQTGGPQVNTGAGPGLGQTQPVSKNTFAMT